MFPDDTCSQKRKMKNAGQDKTKKHTDRVSTIQEAIHQEAIHESETESRKKGAHRPKAQIKGRLPVAIAKKNKGPGSRASRSSADSHIVVTRKKSFRPKKKKHNFFLKGALFQRFFFRPITSFSLPCVLVTYQKVFNNE
jgi:hypothetical protein